MDPLFLSRAATQKRPFRLSLLAFSAAAVALMPSLATAQSPPYSIDAAGSGTSASFYPSYRTSTPPAYWSPPSFYERPYVIVQSRPVVSAGDYEPTLRERAPLPRRAPPPKISAAPLDTVVIPRPS